MKCNLWFISVSLILAVFVCRYSFGQEIRVEADVYTVTEVFPYPVGGEVVPTEVEVVSPHSESMEVIPESVEEMPDTEKIKKTVSPQVVELSTEETKKTVSPQAVELSTEEMEKNVIPQSVSVPTNKEMRTVVAPVAEPVEIMEEKNISPPRKDSERIKGMQKLDNIRPVTANEHKR